MALPKTDSFTGTPFQHLHDYDANWVYYRDSDVTHNLVRLNSDGDAVYHINNSVSFYGWEGDGAFDADQYAQIKATAVASGGYVGVIVRGSKTDDTHATCYGFFGASDDGFYLFYYNNDATEHDLVHYTDTNLAVNDVLRMEISGSNIVCKVNGGTIISTSDSTISAAGHAGICVYGNTAAEIDDFEGGDLAGSAYLTKTLADFTLTASGTALIDGDLDKTLAAFTLSASAVGPILTGTTTWGHVTGVTETNTRTFTDNWTGTGSISGSGDAEKLSLTSGQYMESEVVNTGAILVQLLQNSYQAADTVTLEYRMGATTDECGTAVYSAYSAPFTSTGYVQIKVTSTL